MVNPTLATLATLFALSVSSIGVHAQCTAAPGTPLTKSFPLAGLSAVSLLEVPAQGGTKWNAPITAESQAVRVFNDGTGPDVVVTIQIDGPAALLSQFTTSIDETSNTITAKVQQPPVINQGDCIKSLISITFPASTTILPPITIDTSISTIYLPATPASLDSLSVSSTSGGVYSTAALTVNKDLQIKTTSGDVSLKSGVSAATLVSSTTSGNARFANASIASQARLSAQSGSITALYVSLGKTATTLDVKTTSGDIVLAGLTASGAATVKVETNSGNGWFGLDKTSFGSVAFKTEAGTLKLGSGITPSQADQKAAGGKIGGGGDATLTAASTSGNLQAIAEVVSGDRFTIPQTAPDVQQPSDGDWGRSVASGAGRSFRCEFFGILVGFAVLYTL
ncbi:uncharacterized protein EV422DRAFT_395066 [Fimicolochytrium jonesii]|uniref:uncharacterized protein n=1 Tax=Fimicolochytrium jonesii TaxID=1396493 RepID=UPI0022FE0131|nr:uncharacterized protein EV422DRAFT_395066 [Fimicolochytrium jonesii]KAI8823182.1 hypothetical protein EV422DRAFT_395066 [Fimicolochytrium jonesii]